MSQSIMCEDYAVYCTFSMMNGPITEPNPASASVCSCALLCWSVCVCVSYSGCRTVVLTVDRLENRFPGDADTHKPFSSSLSFQSLYSCLRWLCCEVCYLCSGGGRQCARCQSLLGDSASGKQWHQSWEGKRWNLWTKSGETEMSLFLWTDCEFCDWTVKMWRLLALLPASQAAFWEFLEPVKDHLNQWGYVTVLTCSSLLIQCRIFRAYNKYLEENYVCLWAKLITQTLQMLNNLSTYICLDISEYDTK